MTGDDDDLYRHDRGPIKLTIGTLALVVEGILSNASAIILARRGFTGDVAALAVDTGVAHLTVTPAIKCKENAKTLSIFICELP